MSDEILEYLENKNVLLNICNTEHDFYAIFPKDKFDFSDTNFKYYLYFDSLEGKAYIIDFLRFIANTYNTPSFSIDNFKLVLNEFTTYLIRHHVFFYNKTKMGLMLSTNNIKILLKTLSTTLKDVTFTINTLSNQINFTKEQIDLNAGYTFSFFHYLTKKMDGYNNSKYIVEPITKHVVDDIRNFYKGIKYEHTLPFFLDVKNPFFQDLKPRIIETVVSNNYNQIYGITHNDSCVAIVTTLVNKHTATIDIIMDYSFYNTDIYEAILFVCYDIFNRFKVDTITCINYNKHLAYSTTNNVLTMAGFKPDYSLDSKNDGYSQIKYDLDQENFTTQGLTFSKDPIKLFF